MLTLIGSLLTLGVAPMQGRPPMSPPPFDDHALMMKKLGVSRLRPGPDPNRQDTFDEAIANPFKDSLPNVLQFENGRPVTSPADWTKRRREIVELFEREVYGRVPKNAPKVTWEVTGVTTGSAGSIPTVTRTLVGHVDNRRYPKLKVDIRATYTVPVGGTERVPLMLEFGFPFMRPRPDQKPWGQIAIEHGWGYGVIEPNSIQPDNNHLELGVIGLCNQGQPRKPDDWGALRAWAWGASRLLDYFERDKSTGVDATKVGIEGVSRYGKAALVATAFDPRFAVGLIGSSGEGGAKLHRHIFGEAVENLAGGEFYWMAGNFIKYGCDEPRRTAADIPVDSHQLLALCAPRPLFLSHGVVEKGDAKWIDAHGAFMSGVLAGPVYRLLGAKDLGTPGDYLTDPMPPVNQLIGGQLAWRQHDGGHEVTPNWPSFFNWVSGYISAPALPQGAKPFRVTADMPSPRTDQNSLIAHQQLVEKASKGGIDVYFLGDSITRRWGTSDAAWSPMLANWRQNFYGWNAGNFGWGADGTQNMLWRIKNGELDGVNPKVIVILAGTNNIGYGTSPEETFRGVRALVQTCQEKAKDATIILTAIFPRNDDMKHVPKIEATNRMLAKLADGKRVRFLNVNDRMADANGKLFDGIAIDNLHLSVKGYQVWADGLRPLLRELLGPRSSVDTAPPPTGDPSATPPPGNRK